MRLIRGFGILLSLAAATSLATSWKYLDERAHLGWVSLTVGVAILLASSFPGRAKYLAPLGLIAAHGAWMAVRAVSTEGFAPLLPVAVHIFVVLWASRTPEDK